MYVNPTSREVALVYDDYTLVSAGWNRRWVCIWQAGWGVVPRWLPAKAWESLRADHFVIAAPTAMVRREIEPMLKHSPLMVQRLRRSRFVGRRYLVGRRGEARRQVDHPRLRVGQGCRFVGHFGRMVEALKTLTESFVKNLHAPGCMACRRSPSGVGTSRRGRPSVGQHEVPTAGQRLAVANGRRVGQNAVGSFMSAIAAAAECADAGTKTGMMALVEDFFHDNFHDITSRETIQWGEIAKTKEGNFSIRYKHRARFWNGEPTIRNQVFTFDPQGQFVSVNDADKPPSLSPPRVYQVHKKVSDFPNREDLTTPEAAYASINRAYAAEGDAAWPRLSVPSLAAWMHAHQQKLSLSLPGWQGRRQTARKSRCPSRSRTGSSAWRSSKSTSGTESMR